MAELTTKQRLFVTYYLGKAHGNATAAARLAGYAWPDRAGQKLVAKSSIRAAIDAKLDEASLTADEILARLSEHATANIDDFIEVTQSGEFTLSLAKAKRRGKLGLIKKLKQGEHGVEFQLHDAQAALVKLGTYRGLFKDRIEISTDTEDVERFRDKLRPTKPAEE